jgi:hypothetical protein
MRPRFFTLLFLSVAAVLASGCGKGEGAANRPPDLDFTGPVYPVLPDTAPLRDQLDEAAAYVERELLEEQEKFFLKRGEETQAYYRGPDGSPLVPESSLRNMISAMQISANPRLKIISRNFHLRVSQDPGGVREPPENTTVRMMGEAVPAIGEYAGQGEGTRLRVSTVYEYPNGPVQREIYYQKQPDGRWSRIRIRETGAAPQPPAPPAPPPPQNTGDYPPRPPR